MLKLEISPLNHNLKSDLSLFLLIVYNHAVLDYVGKCSDCYRPKLVL